MLGQQYGIANLETEMLEAHVSEGQRVDPSLAVTTDERGVKPGSFKTSAAGLKMIKALGMDVPSDALFKQVRDYMDSIPRDKLPGFVGKKSMPDAQDFIAHHPREAFKKWMRLSAKVDARIGKYIRKSPTAVPLIFFMIMARISGADMAKGIFKRYFSTDSDHPGQVTRDLKARGKGARVVGTADLSGVAEEIEGLVEGVVSDTRRNAVHPRHRRARIEEQGMLTLIEKDMSANLGKHLKGKGSDGDGDGKKNEKSVPPWERKGVSKKEDIDDLAERIGGGMLAGGANRQALLKMLKKRKEKEEAAKKAKGKQEAVEAGAPAADADAADAELGEGTGLERGFGRQMMLNQLRQKKAKEDAKKKSKSIQGKKVNVKEDLELELKRLESTTSAFPEVRERRIASVREELEALA